MCSPYGRTANVSLLNHLRFFTRLMSVYVFVCVCACVCACACVCVCVIAVSLPYNGACVDIVHKVCHVSIFLW